MKLTLKNKIYIGLIALLVVFGGSIYVTASRIISGALLEEHRNRGLLITNNLAVWAREPVLTMDFLRLKTLVDEAVHSNKDVSYAFVLNAQGEVLAHTFTGGFPVQLKAVNSVSGWKQTNRVLLDTGADLLYDFAAPVLIGEDRFGTVRLGLSQKRVKQAINSLSVMMLLSTALIVAVSGVISGALARTVGKRIETLHRSIERVMRGDLDVETAPRLKKNCWDIMKCSREACPAYKEPRLRCWYVAGTLCPSCVEGEYAKKIESCFGCRVFRACSGDEIQDLAESFDFMVRMLKNHLQELKAVGASLSEQQHLLKTILNATPDFVSLQDRDSVYRAANKAFCSIVGRSEEEIIGKTDHDFFSPARARAIREEDLQVLQSGEPLTKEERIGEGCNARWIHVVKLPVRDGSGAIVGLLCSGRDITDVKTFQERLMRAQKMEAVGQLTAGIAHEINTPLGIILGYAQLLLEDVAPDSQMHSDLKTIEKHTRICRKIVSDLLRFSHHTESSMAPLDVNQVVEEALSVVEHTFSLDRVRIRRSLEAGIPEVIGDEEKLKQALVNLLNNAFDAIGTDGMILVSSSSHAASGEVLLSVADTGKGIPVEHMDKIFDPFFTTKGVGKGTGLGLSVTFGIVKDHGGRIEAWSPLRPALMQEMASQGLDAGSLKGAVFTIFLPASRLDAGARKD